MNSSPAKPLCGDLSFPYLRSRIASKATVPRGGHHVALRRIAFAQEPPLDERAPSGEFNEWVKALRPR
jgi:hypothetical protein